MDFQSHIPAVILVRPQIGENIGAAARAMLNFGLTDLRLVAPRDGWPNTRAEETSAGALDKMPTPQIFPHLSDALHDRHHAYATTARRRDLNKPVLDLEKAASRIRKNPSENAAFVFGPERTGLTNEDLSFCHTLVSIPANPAFSSLNLAQAVLITAYKLRDTNRNTNNSSKTRDNTLDPPAPAPVMQALMDRLEMELDKHHFFRTREQKPTTVHNIRNMLMRAQMSEQEVQTFQGMVSALIGRKNPKTD